MKQLYKHLNLFDFHILLYDIFKALLIYLFATLAALCLVDASVLSDNIFGVYMLAVAFTSSVTNGYICGILSSIGGVIGVNFFFTYPYFALNFSIAGYPVTFTLMLLMSILASFLTTKVKKAAIIAADGKRRAETLNEMSKAILTANDLDSIIEIAASYFFEASQSSVIFYLGSPMAPDKMTIKTTQEIHEPILRSILERQVAYAAFSKGRITGADIDTSIQNCKGTYFPISADAVNYGRSWHPIR